MELERLQNAFLKADQAGNTEDARVFAKAIRELQAQPVSSPDERIQQAFDEIAQSFNTQDSAGASVSSRERGFIEAGVDSIQDSGPIGEFLVDRGADFANDARAAFDGITSLAFNLDDELEAGVKSGFGFTGDFDKELKGARDRRELNEIKSPNAKLAAQIFGGVGLGSGLHAAKLTATSKLPQGASLFNKTKAGAIDGAFAGSTFGAGGRDGDFVDRIDGAIDGGLLGGVLGGGIPLAGSTLRAGGGIIKDKIAPTFNALINPSKEASRRVSSAISRDGMPVIDDAAAATNGQTVLNADRGGETTRALARSVANQSPETREVLSRVTSDRFESQGARASSLIDRIVGGQADDIAFQTHIKDRARRTNGPAYRAAYNSPRAQALWSENFEQLMQSPAIQKAAKDATTRGANRAAVDGFTPVRNPFNFDEAGRFTLKARPDGSQALPNLAFWDQVKRNLDGQIGTARRSGDNPLVSDLTAIKSQLVRSLDGAVPEYKAARQGAAGFFDADDALEAGKKFVNQNKDIRGSIEQIKKFSKEEREAFRVGFAAELKESISKTRDRTNVINQIFGSKAARDKIRVALGREGAQEMESFVKVEQVQDMLRNAVQGNSTTARQLAELGLGAGVGGFSTGDMQGAITGAVIARAARMSGGKIESNVMKRVADILLSDDPKKLSQGVKIIAKNKKFQKALDRLQGYLEQSATFTAAGPIASQ